MDILGISCFGQESAACLVRDGEIIAAAQEERFTRNKYDNRFPLNSIKWCLEEGGIRAEDLDWATFYDTQPWNKFKVSFLLRKLLNYRNKVIAFTQKESYLASAFYPSPFEEAAILVNDSLKVRTVLGKGEGAKVDFLENSRFPGSLGLIYSAVTHYLGFAAGLDEYKIMGLSAYGKPKHRGLIIQNKVQLSRADWGFTDRLLSYLFSSPPRKANSEITQQHMDISASLQSAIEEEVLERANYLYQSTHCPNLCFSGQVALNCLANSAVLQQGLFQELWIQPASGDSGCAIGAALLLWHKYLGNERQVDNKSDMMKNGFLGPHYSEGYIEAFLKSQKIRYRKLEVAQVPDMTADLLAAGNVVGWFQGRLEFGPRALGCRSILADSRNLNMHDRINLRVKFREPFRPLAPVILAERAKEYFCLERESPYMLLISQAKEGRKNEIPAAIHIDNSSRFQTIKREAQSLYYDTVKAFYDKTGCPVLVNTSFNRKGEPIVCSPEDAFVCFMQTDMDYLVMERFLLDKKAQNLPKKI
jgi:carbamoyltransferase